MGELSEFIADAHENGYATTDPDAGEERQGRSLPTGEATGSTGIPTTDPRHSSAPKSSSSTTNPYAG